MSNLKDTTTRGNFFKRSNNHWIVLGDERLCATEWAERLNTSRSVIFARLNRGWSVEDAVTKPVRRYKKNAQKL